MEKEVERKLGDRIVRRVAKELRVHDLHHSKPTFLVRPCGRFAQFVHFHRFRFGPQFRLHFGVRVMNDPFVAIALNGPAFEHAGVFDENEEHSLECTRQLVTLIEKEALPWFGELSSDDALLTSPKTPLIERDRIALSEDMGGQISEECWELSRRLLGVAKND